jgi:hypothetical protein
VFSNPWNIVLAWLIAQPVVAYSERLTATTDEMTTAATNHSDLVRRAIILAAVALGVLLVPVACVYSMMEEPPELLRRARANGVWSAPCPPETETERVSRENTSPELNDRLAKRFPAGSREVDLVAELKREGFSAPSIACKNDVTIKQAGFRKQVFMYETDASVYWKVEGQAIVWTKGFLFYRGL